MNMTRRTIINAIIIICFFVIGYWSPFAFASETGVVLQKVKVDLHDEAVLQRGAKTFMNYCAGCHSLQYMRYDRMAADLDMTTLAGKVDEAVLKQNLIFDQHAKMSDPMISAMQTEDANAWFGIAVPDLSLTARLRGTDWIYTYLKSFYRDTSKKPWGVNNALYANVAMPHVLERLQGVQILQTDAVDSTQHYLLLKQAGEQSPAEFEQTLTDIVTFLAYVAEPTKIERQRIGVYVIGFLLIFSIFATLLRREYWKDIK